jgi:hypothetical protein
MKIMKAADPGTPAQGCHSAQIHVAVFVLKRDRAIRSAKQRHRIRGVIVVRLVGNARAGLIAVKVHFQIRIGDVSLADRMLRLVGCIHIGRIGIQLPVFPEK